MRSLARGAASNPLIPWWWVSLSIKAIGAPQGASSLGFDFETDPLPIPEHFQLQPILLPADDRHYRDAAALHAGISEYLHDLPLDG